MCPIENPQHSRPIDVHRWSDHPEVRGFVDGIWEQYFEETGNTGRRPQQPFRNQLRVVVLDLYVAWLEDPELNIGVSMSSNSWHTGSRYNALHISRKIVTIIKRLADVGLIDLAPGFNIAPGHPDNKTTRIRAAAPLVEWFQQEPVPRDEVGRAEGAELILLRGDPNGRLLEYEDTDETNRMRDELRLYNDVIGSAFIDIPDLDEPRIDDIRTDHHRKLSRRVFSRGNWQANGRFHGGWWQQINSEWRSRIFINDP